MLVLASAGGAATPPAPASADAARAALLQPDGRVVALGTSDGRFALARYLPSGALDGSFGDHGEVTTNLDRRADDEILAAVLEPDGSIVAAGHSAARATVVRYRSDGSLDLGFGDGGSVTLGCCRAAAVAVLPNGETIVAASGGSGSRVYRLSADGAIDRSFSTAEAPVDVRALVPVGDGGIVTAGLSSAGVERSLVVSRLSSDGSPDQSFGSGGTVTAALPVGASVDGIVANADGSVLVAGSAGGQALVARFGPDGSADGSFGDEGSAVLGSQGSTAAAVAPEPDGLAVAGTEPDGLLLGHLDSTGVLDPSFGHAGIVVTPAVSSAASVLEEPSRLIVAGAAGSAGASDFALAAFGFDGSPDASFGEGGLVTTDFGPPAAGPVGVGTTTSPPNHATPHLRADRSPNANRRTAPHPVPAWYVNADSMIDLKRFAAADACAFARSQPRSANRALLLDFGGARAYVNGNFGAAVNNASFTASNRQIRIALQVAADAYASCHRRGQAQITYAVTNHFKSRFAASRARQIGVHQARTVHRLWRYQRVHGYTPAERAGVAGDIEAGYWGPKYSRLLANGAKATWPRGYMDFGTAGGCPPHPGLHYHGCFNGWTLGDVAQVSHDRGGEPLPEIYYRGNPNHFDQAAQWASVARKWNSAHSTPYVFAGTTGSTQFSGMTPGESWVRMRRKAPGHVGRELLNFKEDHFVAKSAGDG